MDLGFRGSGDEKRKDLGSMLEKLLTEPAHGLD